MNIEQIRELVNLLEDSKLNSLEISEGELSIRLEKNAKQEVISMPAMAYTNALAQPLPVGEGALAADPVSPAPAAKGTAVKSPMVGVFYAAPSPEADPYVAVGDTVKKGQVLCIVEAMKLMNEIVAESDGIIAEICLESGQVVEYGQPLFYLK